METTASFRSCFSTVPQDYTSQVNVSRFWSKPVVSKAWIQQQPLVSCRKFSSKSAVRASIRSSDYGSSSVASGSPLQLESPIGQFLSQMLISHPHLVQAAVEHQLEQFKTDTNAENHVQEPLLNKRIAEVKCNQRGKALEEILYTIVVQRFNDANVPLVSNIIPSTPCGRVETCLNDQSKLVQLHSPESYEMIKNHLSHVLGDFDSNTIAAINKARIGQVYAASAIYGYFLRRVDERYQMDKKMKNMANGIGHDDFSSRDNSTGVITSRLKNYVTSFDKVTLQRYAKIRSTEVVSIIEKHTAALFGRVKVAVAPIGSSDLPKDENIDISIHDFRTLILEGLTFGSFLWDAESYVDLKCHLVAY